MVDKILSLALSQWRIYLLHLFIISFYLSSILKSIFITSLPILLGSF